MACLKESCLCPYHEAYRWKRGMAPLILKHSTRYGGERSAAYPTYFIPKKVLQCLLKRRLVLERKYLFPLL